MGIAGTTCIVDIYIGAYTSREALRDRFNERRMCAAAGEDLSRAGKTISNLLSRGGTNGGDATEVEGTMSDAPFSRGSLKRV